MAQVDISEDQSAIGSMIINTNAFKGGKNRSSFEKLRKENQIYELT